MQRRANENVEELTCWDYSLFSQHLVLELPYKSGARLALLLWNCGDALEHSLGGEEEKEEEEAGVTNYDVK